MPHPFIPDGNDLDCRDCPLPPTHPCHDVPAASSPAPAFSSPPPPPDDPPVLPDPSAMGVRLTPDQPSTSQAAAQVAWPRAGTARHFVLLDLDVAGETGCTDEDLAADLDMSLNTVRPRRGELVAGGWVTQARSPRGEPLTRPTESGNDAAVWVLTPTARRHLAAESEQRAS